MVLNATFNNNSVILWPSFLLVKETGVPGENQRPPISHWQTLLHKAVSSTPHHVCDRGIKRNPFLQYYAIYRGCRGHDCMVVLYNYLCNQCLSPPTFLVPFVSQCSIIYREPWTKWYLRIQNHLMVKTISK
jgi:hypothetical protein